MDKLFQLEEHLKFEKNRKNSRALNDLLLNSSFFSKTYQGKNLTSRPNEKFDIHWGSSCLKAQNLQLKHESKIKRQFKEKMNRIKEIMNKGKHNRNSSKSS